MADPASAAPMLLYAIAPTQFSVDARRVDAGAMAANMERLAGAGIRRVLLTGSYGEFTALGDDERLEVLASVLGTGVCDETMACAASLSSEATARLAVRMLEAGADLVMVSPPLGCETSDRDVLRHFEHMSGTVGSRLVVYNNPAFGHDLEPALIAEIMAMDGYVALKQGTRDLSRLLGSVEALRAGERAVRILIASDLSAAMTLTAAVDGLTSTNSWVFPEAIVTLVEAADRGDLAIMQAHHRALARYRRFVARMGQPAAVKAAMTLRGYAGSTAVRAPYEAVAQEELKELGEILADCDRRLAAIRTRTSQAVPA